MTEIQRDRWGRPLIVHPEGLSLKPIPYKRASSLGGILEDTHNIMLWKQRLTAQGIAKNQHLALKVSAAGEDKQALNAVALEAFELAGGSRRADIGTAVHALTEKYDRGEDLGFVPDEYEGDLDAYAVATKFIKWLSIEQFVVCDELQVAGTPDRIGRLLSPVTFDNGVTLPTGWQGIFDVKTGSVGFPHGFSVQLATYAHSKGYDPATGKRFALPDVSDEYGVLIHLPAGEGECSLHLLDIAGGWKAAHLALEVDAWRKRKDLTFDAIELEAV